MGWTSLPGNNRFEDGQARFPPDITDAAEGTPLRRLGYATEPGV
jgi:hypothetical protein